MPTWDAGLPGGAILRLSATSAEDINGNFSDVSWSLQLIKGSYSSWTATPIGWSANIGGVGYSGSYTFDFRSSGSVLIAATTTRLYHNADGTLTTSFTGHTNATGTSTGGPADTGGGWTLPTIPRASSASFTNPMTIGTAYTISISRASTSFTHTVQYFFGSASGTIATGVATSTSWTPDVSLLNQIPNSPTGSGIIRVITYSGATQIGYKDFGVTLSAAADVVPTLTGITDTESVSSISTIVGQYVQGMSKPTLGVTGAAGVYGSTIKAYSITLDGQTITSASGTVSNPLSSSGTLTITATVTDTRNRTATLTKTISVLAYARPQIISASTQRAGSTGTPADEGTYIRVNLNAASSSLVVGGTEKNKLVYKISTRARGASVWSLQKTVTIPSPGVTFDGYDLVSPYDITSAWEVLTEISDQFNTSSSQTTVATAKIFMHWGGQDQGLGIGKYWETGRGAMDVLGQIYQNDGAAVLDEVTIIPHQAVIGTVDPLWLSGLPTVTIDGDSGTSGGYMWDSGSSGSWVPAPGQRVYLTPSSIGGYIISGPVVESRSVMNMISLTPYLGPNITTYDTSWRDPAVSRSTIGIVVIEGLIKTTAVIGVGSTLVTLPSGFRPAWASTERQRFSVNNSDGATTIDIYGDGRVTVVNSIASGTYISLTNLAFPGETSSATYTPIGTQAGTDPVRFQNGWVSHSNTTFGTPGYWVDPYGVIWWKGLIQNPASSLTDNTLMVLVADSSLYTSSINPYQHHIGEQQDVYCLISYGALTSTYGVIYKTAGGSAWAAGAHRSLTDLRTPTVSSDSLIDWSQTPGFANSWSNYATNSYTNMGFGRRPDGLIQTQGLIKGGALGSGFTLLPAGMRPRAYQGASGTSYGILQNRPSSAGRGRLDIRSDGNIVFVQGSTTWSSLDGFIYVPEV